MLRQNQKNALNETIKNNFQSGVYFHATGTGKSWISLEIILEFNKKYPKKNIFWICEQKSILIEQFDKEVIKSKGYKKIFKKFMIKNYTQKKPKDWFRQIELSRMWGKPQLVVINRSFLVSQKKYEKINLPFHLIIHDECHSIVNKTTQEFYNYMLKKNEEIKCLGFSATPNLTCEPYKNIISSYSIYDAYIDNVILKPNIKWIKSDKKLNDLEILSYCKWEINKLYYKKVIVWCGMIKYCNILAELWKQYFNNYLICIDTSEESNNFKSIEDFKKCEKNAILFCACKHREGSDIKNLDCCIFLDKVENRNPKTFVQCIGRVLRKDKLNKKKEGLIIDLKATSCLKICDRINLYLNCKNNFPWIYSYKYKKIGKKKILISSLELSSKEQKPQKNTQVNITTENIREKFIYDCPNEKIYIDRLNKELKLLKEKNLYPYLIRAIEILKLTNYIPHVTRGSCGSSLVCYLLGISNVDPIKYNIKFERFLNSYRMNLPDIDLDFPHYLRDEVFLKLELNWPNQVARISNHVYWHEKSALREAIRRVGINKQIPKTELNSFIKKLPKSKREKIKACKEELVGTFRHYSLHCGGIVFYHDGVPEELILKNNNEKKTLSQIIYDKRDISKNKNFKIDILSSRGISQLIDICGKKIDFSVCPYDEKTYNLLQSGDNIGITLAESPLMRKALLKIKPKNISDIALCLAIIRPAAKDARIQDNDIDFETKFVYDDDAIRLLSKYLKIDDDLSDKFRRCLSKNTWEKKTKEKYDKLLSNLSNKDRLYLTNALKNLRYYSFCKSHSYSYAQLVYKLAYQKAHNPAKFWRSTLKNNHSSYRKWVHLYEAARSGINVQNIINKSNDCSIYATHRRKKFKGLSQEEQLKKYGYWNMTNNKFFPNCYFYKKQDVYYFGGLIASLRVLNFGKKKRIICSIGISKGKYIEVVTEGVYYNNKHYGLKGRAYITDNCQQTYKAFIAKYY